MTLTADDVMQMNGAALYIGLFLLPFVQEDAAVVAGATASMTGMGPAPYCFGAVLAGLISSDVWKYWAGWLARRYPWAHRFAEKPGVVSAGRLIKGSLLRTLLIARFVPGTRIPTYVACGFFKAPYLRFCLYVAVTALAYVGAVFGLFHVLGAVAGERAKYWLPALALAALALYLGRALLRRRRAGGHVDTVEELDAALREAPADATGQDAEKKKEERDRKSVV